MITEKDMDKLRAFIATEGNEDVIGEGGCDTCGFGRDEGYSISEINNLLDRFLKSEINKEGEKNVRRKN